MKASAVFAAACFSLVFQTAIACGTREPEAQRRIDAAELDTLRRLVVSEAREADLIFIGTVTALDRPQSGSGGFGSATFNIEEMLKGTPPAGHTVRWKDKFIYSCHPSAMFNNVGFRKAGRFIVYVQEGQVTRSAAADQLGEGGLL